MDLYFTAVVSGPNYCFELLGEKGPKTKCVGNSVKTTYTKHFISGLQSLAGEEAAVETDIGRVHESHLAMRKRN